MIKKDQVISLLLSACPSFSGHWEQYRQAPEYEEGVLYLDLGQYAHHLVRLYEDEVAQEFPAVFQTIEQLYREGNGEVTEALTRGLLEEIRNIAGNNGLDPKVFWPYLESESSMYWITLNVFWSGKRKTGIGEQRNSQRT
jgi:hypothetical protein